MSTISNFLGFRKVNYKKNINTLINKSKLSLLIIYLAETLRAIIFIFTLGYFIIDLPENLLFSCKWIKDD